MHTFDDKNCQTANSLDAKRTMDRYELRDSHDDSAAARMQ